MNLAEAQALTDKTEVFIRATVLGGTHRPIVDSDGFVSASIPYGAGGGGVSRSYHHSSFECVAPPKPDPLKPGDMTDKGLILAVRGREAWVDRRPEGEPDCDTYELSELTRA